MIPSSCRSAPTPRPLRGKRGFTILEVALAGFVLTFALAGSITTIQAGFRNTDVARGTTLASQIIQSEMERLRLMAWNNTSTTAVDSICELPASEVVSLSTMFGTNSQLSSHYTVTRTVTADATRPDDVKYIKVSVTWQSSDGQSHTRSFQTMYAKNGLYDYYYTNAK